MSDIGNFIAEHVWIPVVGGIVLIIIVGVAIWCCCRWRHYRRFDYTALRDDLELPAKMELERRVQEDQIRDAALMNCQFYVRSIGRYTIIDQLSEIGSRFNKNWFLVRDKKDRQEKLLSMTQKSEHMLIPFNATTKNILSELFLLLRHPYIYPKSEVDFSTDQNLVVSSEPYNLKGSLKDHIYVCKCTDPWGAKYRERSRGLPLTQVQTFGRQILEALMFLDDKGFPSHGHLHSGNIIVQNYVARITGYENIFFGLSSKLQPMMKKKLRDDKEAIDVLSFGHILFEMAAGYELDSAHPDPKHLVSISHSPVIQVLNFIFENEEAFYPSIRQIAEHEFFKYVQLKELQTYNPAPINFTQQMKSLLKAMRKGVAIKTTKSGKIKTSKKSGSIAGDENVQSTSRHSKSSKSRRTSSMASSAPGGPPASVPPPPAAPSTSIPPPPPNIPPPPPTSMSAPGAPLAPPSSTGERGALLGQIRGGARLKKAVTNDRSNPKV